MANLLYSQLYSKRGHQEESEDTLIERNLANTTKFQVYRMVPRDKEELAALNALYQMSSEFEIDFWKAPTGVEVFADMMVPPEFAVQTKSYLTQNHLQYQVIIEDVQKLIMQREKPQSANSLVESKGNLSSANPLLSSFFSKRMKDAPYVSRNKAKYGFGDYHSYNEIMKWMNEIELHYPQMAKGFTLNNARGKTNQRTKIGNR
uniref:Carboxypeptidase activation peptide domain-containing protein n=1 Tax=Ditylenchus dipsaci TaxID=166011 RepID=A0A915DWR2_9BILA